MKTLLNKLGNAREAFDYEKVQRVLDNIDKHKAEQEKARARRGTRGSRVRGVPVGLFVDRASAAGAPDKARGVETQAGQGGEGQGRREDREAFRRADDAADDRATPPPRRGARLRYKGKIKKFEAKIDEHHVGAGNWQDVDTSKPGAVRFARLPKDTFRFVESTAYNATFDPTHAYFRRADMPQTGRGDSGYSVETSRCAAAAATWKFRGDGSRRRRGRDVEIPCRRVAATPRLRRGIL